jgi:hypothetical protein
VTNIESSTESLANIEALIHGQSEQLENSRKHLADLNDAQDDTRPLEDVLTKISAIEKELSLLDARLAAIDRQNAPRRKGKDSDAQLSRLEAIKERNRSLDAEYAMIARRHSRLAPFVHRWKHIAAQSGAIETPGSEDIDELLLMAEKKVEASGSSRPISGQELERQRSQLYIQIDNFRMEERRLLEEIQNARAKSEEVEASLVEEIAQLRLKVAQQRLRKEHKETPRRT